MPELELLAEADEAGVYLVASRDGRSIFVSGHADTTPTLLPGIQRDIARGMHIVCQKTIF